MTIDQDFDRAVEIGKSAFGYLQKSKTPPVPKNYELFFTFATGSNKDLNEAVRKTLQTKSQMGAEDAAIIYDTYLGSNRLDNMLEEVGSNMSGEIREVLDSLTSATNCTTAFSDSLDQVNQQLGRISDPKQIKVVIQTVLAATQKMADNSRELEDRLSASHKQISELHMDLEVVRAESFTDELTGIPNRKRYDHELADAVSEADATKSPLSLLMIDIDYFKKFNDTHGHLAGDGVLRLVAKTMQSCVKGRDLVARYGGEEFSVILPDTELQDAVTVAEQIRNAVKTKELVKKSSGESLGHVTLSIGAALHTKGEDPKALIERADACLYAAKHAGRDQVKIEADQDQSAPDTSHAA